MTGTIEVLDQGATPPPPPVVTEAPKAPELPPQEAPRFVDPDDIELAAAREEAANEAKGRTEQQPPAPSPPKADPPAPTKAQPGPVPYERFSEVNKAAAALRDENIYLKGALTALQGKSSEPQPTATTAPAKTDPNPQQQQTHADRIAAEQAALLAASERLDRGEIGYRDYEQIRLKTDDNIAALRADAMRAEIARTMPQQQVQSLADQHILNVHAKQIEDTFPYLGIITDAQLDLLRDLAFAEAQLQGRPIGTGPAETMRLRQMIAELSAVHGPRWHPVAKITPVPAGGATQPPPRSQAAQDRLTKMGMAATMPPNTAAMGSTGPTGTEFTEARIAEMSDEEIAALPATVRARIKGG
jgi:hypothetical protein